MPGVDRDLDAAPEAAAHKADFGDDAVAGAAVRRGSISKYSQGSLAACQKTSISLVSVAFIGSVSLLQKVK